MRLFNLWHGLLLVTAFDDVSGLSPAEWRKQSIYQVMTDRFARSDLSTKVPCNTSETVYCGGTWAGLRDTLDYIQGMGFSAIWLSPVNKQMDGNTKDGESYHGYWPVDIYRLNPAFGSQEDLLSLSHALHQRGMYLMVDVVPNHMAYKGCGNCTNFSLFTPFDSSKYFHPYCPIDYNNQTSIELCWQGDDIVALADLRTEDIKVRRLWYRWIQGLIARYSIDGVRIDSAKHMDQPFLSGFQEAAGDVYMMGEVYASDPGFVASYQQFLTGVLDYPTFGAITGFFQSTNGSISYLLKIINQTNEAALDTSLYGSFLENHDQPRFASYTSDLSLAKNAVAFTMLKDGIPIIYQGLEQRYSGKGPYSTNREAVWLSGYNTSSRLYRWIAKLNRIRRAAIDANHGYLAYQACPIYADNHTIAMRKGVAGAQIVSVYTNLGSNANVTHVWLSARKTDFEPFQDVTDAMSCDSYRADSDGNLQVAITRGLPRVFFPTLQSSRMGICSLDEHDRKT